MNSQPPSDVLAVRLDRRRGGPLYQQIYERIREAILGGALTPGSRLPSSRSLAATLGASRGTVELAYNLLAGEGYVVGHAAAGTIVEPQLSVPPRTPFARSRAGSRSWPTDDQPAAPKPFRMGLPALDAFPRKLWSRLAARRARTLSAPSMVYQDPAGYWPLREEIANYLAIARGISCTPDQIFVTAGFQGALGLIAQTLLRDGSQVWVEDPGYPLARRGLALAGARLVPVPVDAEGLNVGAGMRKAPEARMALVTPTHQSPLGVTLSLPRRLELLAWARQAYAWIVEDDYDSEFRYRGRPLPALRSLDETGHVLYVGTFSKSLFPALRLGYVVVPPPQINRFLETAWLLHAPNSQLEQMTVTDFMAQGHFARHIKRMRGLYAERRSALAAATEDVFGDRMRIEAPAGGLHILAWLRRRQDDAVLAERAAAHGLAPGALSTFAVAAKCPPALLLSFTNVPAEAAGREVRRLQRALA